MAIEEFMTLEIIALYYNNMAMKAAASSEILMAIEESLTQVKYPWFSNLSFNVGRDGYQLGIRQGLHMTVPYISIFQDGQYVVVRDVLNYSGNPTYRFDLVNPTLLPDISSIVSIIMGIVDSHPGDVRQPRDSHVHK